MLGKKVLINRRVENSRIRTRRVPAGTKKGGCLTRSVGGRAPYTDTEGAIPLDDPCHDMLGHPAAYREIFLEYKFRSSEPDQGK